MAQDIKKTLEEAGAPAREFWENDLEMALENTDAEYDAAMEYIEERAYELALDPDQIREVWNLGEKEWAKAGF
jgi:hypothetical protein